MSRGFCGQCGDPYSEEEYECLERIVDLHNHIVKTNWGD